MLNLDLKLVLIQKKLESIDLIAENWTFVTKGEFKSYFLTTPTGKAKLNHCVNTTLHYAEVPL